VTLSIAAPTLAQEATLSAGTAQVGETAPDFTLYDHEGNPVTLSELQGKIVVLEWTNPDCPFVKRHYKSDAMTMVNIANDYAEKDVVWLSINSTHYFSRDKNVEWVSSKELSYPVLSDVAGDVGRLYGAKTTPHMYVIDTEGTLAYAGAIDNDQRGTIKEPTNYVRAALDALIAGEAIESPQTKPYGCSVKYAKRDAS
jgi:peroxiredoxin